MDQTFISDLLVRGIIGISDRERSQKQDILINIILYGDISQAGKTDSIDDCINYRTVAKKVVAYVERAERYTVEALAADVARICLEEPGVEGVKIRIEKPGAVRFSRSVGVEIERRRDQNQLAGHQAYISLGSNINPVENILNAIEKLSELCVVYAVSTVWETEAVGQPGPRFLNATAWISTHLGPVELKEEILQEVENSLGRVRTADKNAPRTIDLDILLYDEKVLDTTLWTRDYLAIPTAELRPDLADPESGKSINEITQALKLTSNAIPRLDIRVPFLHQRPRIS
jgi:2-amino-4-hydroxy-6-hydroxymethyldihydropteridine diphosphokinase